MKFLAAIALTAAAACAAPQTHAVNVARVRDDIKDAIDHDASHPRQIVSMGRTTYDNAVVYTQTDANAPRHEESWVHSPTGWTLAASKDATASAN